MSQELSQKRMVTLEEVAKLFHRAPVTVKKAVQQDRFPVPPRVRGKGSPMLWSSVDLDRYFDDPKAWAAKRGTKAGGK